MLGGKSVSFLTGDRAFVVKCEMSGRGCCQLLEDHDSQRKGEGKRVKTYVTGRCLRLTRRNKKIWVAVVVCKKGLPFNKGSGQGYPDQCIITQLTGEQDKWWHGSFITNKTTDFIPKKMYVFRHHRSCISFIFIKELIRFPSSQVEKSPLLMDSLWTVSHCFL